MEYSTLKTIHNQKPFLPEQTERKTEIDTATNLQRTTPRYSLSFYKRLKLFSYQLNCKNNGPVLLHKTIFRHSNCFLSSVATDGEDGHGLKLEKGGPTFSSFNAMPAKITMVTDA